MSKKIHIITDSTSDLPKEIIEKYNIDVVPLFVTLGDKTFKSTFHFQSQFVIMW